MERLRLVGNRLAQHSPLSSAFGERFHCNVSEARAEVRAEVRQTAGDV